jgi:large repetitive protein
MKWSLLNHLWQSVAEKQARPRHRRIVLRREVEMLENRSVPSVTPLVGPRPVASDDWIDTDGSTPVTVAVLANDTAPVPLSGGAAATLVPASVRVTAAPKHGHVKVDRNDGSITFTATAGFTGSDTFRYTVRDSKGVISKPATVTIQVNRPTAADDWTDTDAGNSVSLDVLANDTDPDGNNHIHQPGSVAIVSSPAHGTATVDGTTNEVTYTPAAGFGGTDSFRYTVTDDAGATSSPANVFVRVNRPTANDDFATFVGSTQVGINLLENDSDPDGHDHIEQPGSVTIVVQPTHGTVSVESTTNEVFYSPQPGFNGTDSFRYTVTDVAGATSAPATVTVVGTQSIGVSDDVADTDGRNPVSIDVLANDGSAAAGGHLAAGTLGIASAPHHGRARVDRTTGQLIYVANAGFGGTDSFRYKVSSVPGGKLFGTVTVVVNRPTAADDWTDTDAGNPVSLDVLQNDTDPDGAEHIHQPGSVAIVTKPAHGTATVNATTNEVTYTPAAGYGGTDSFRYSVTDDAGATSTPANVFIRVNRPTANADGATTHGSTPVIINVLENDNDPDGHDRIEQPGSVSIVSGATHGTVTVNSATNEVTYKPNPGFVGTDTFRYMVTDEAGATSLPATVTILVEGPVAVSGSFLIVGSTATLNLLNAAVSSEGSGVPPGSFITIVKQPLHGHLTINGATGEVTYTADPGYHRLDKFSYTITDPLGAVSAAAEITLIAPANLLQ